MATTYVDRAYFEIDGTEIECASLEEKSSDSSEPVGTMNRSNRAKGYKRGHMKYELSGEVPMTSDMGISLERTLEDGTLFGGTIEYEGGEKHSFIDCKFSEVTASSKDGDAVMYKVSVFALDRVITS